MPTNKDFKQLVRKRMRKTGEAYTSARANLLEAKPPARSARPPATSDYARLAGRSDAIMKERTGCSWERWVKALDREKAQTWPHRLIAKHVQEKYQLPSWWAQTVTLGYERIKGLRTMGQGRDGSFEASKSRTFTVPLALLYRAFEEPRLRLRWLPDVALTVRTATPQKSMRISWPDRTSVEVGFSSKGTGKSQLAVQHTKLPEKASAARMKQYWAERLDQLNELLLRVAKGY